MLRHTRFLVVLLLAAAVAACSSADLSVTPRLSPAGAKPVAAKVQATDSLMVLTDVAYSDSATVLTRTTALANDITVTALIGSKGGSLSIPQAGLDVEIPANALDATTQVTVTALKGTSVAYEFGPHGTLFRRPVKLEQDLSLTVAGGNTEMQKGMHGSYFPSSLDSAFVDASRTVVKVKEHQLGYKASGSRLKFFVDHFSGYMVSLGYVSRGDW